MADAGNLAYKLGAKVLFRSYRGGFRFMEFGPVKRTGSITGRLVSTTGKVSHYLVRWGSWFPHEEWVEAYDVLGGVETGHEPTTKVDS